MAARSAFAVLAALWLAGCGQDNRYVAPPPPTVTVAPPVQRQVTRYFETTGSTAAVNSANLVARVQGFVQEISYQDGSFVAKGTPLFTIEPEPYRLKQQQAEAAEAAAQATLKQAEAEFERQTELAGRQVTSRSRSTTPPPTATPRSPGCSRPRRTRARRRSTSATRR